MNKLTAETMTKTKQNIKNSYLAGNSVPEIARANNVSPRNIYYHLRGLTAEEKGLHAKNSSLKWSKRKEDHAKKIQESHRKRTETSLADFE